METRASEADEIERLFRRYSVFRALERGGHGSVFQVFDLFQRQSVALKLISLQGLEEGLRRFELEFQLPRVLFHECLLRVYDSGYCRFRDELHYYYTMELCDGSVLHRLPVLSLPERVRVSRQLVSVLVYLHDCNIAHRDVKPENLFLGPGGTLKLGDFGIAKTRHGPAPASLTLTQHPLGTLLYLAPERWPERTYPSETDWRPSDQYAAAITIYQILSSGELPLPLAAARDAADLCAIHHDEPYRPLAVRERPGQRCPAVDQVLTRALRKSAGDRYANLAALQSDLHRALLADGLS